MLHSVPRIEGLMDPIEGRVVLHGHMKAGGNPVIRGGLSSSNPIPGLDSKRLLWTTGVTAVEVGRIG